MHCNRTKTSYMIIDLYNNIGYKCKSLEEVMYWWIQKNPKDDKTGLPEFQKLNMNGKDTLVALPFWMMVPSNLRPYMVVDQDNRIVDIRNIPKNMWTAIYNKSYDRTPIHHSGAKIRMRGRAHLGTLLHDDIRQHGKTPYDITEDIEELNIVLPQPKHMNTAISSDMDNTLRLYQRRMKSESHDRSRSWKQTSKARKQWAKHQKEIDNKFMSIRQINKQALEKEDSLYALEEETKEYADTF